MSLAQKTKTITKLPKTQTKFNTTLQTIKKTSRFAIRGKMTYKVHEKPIYAKQSNQCKISILQTKDKQYIGKFLPLSRQHQVILEIFWLNKLKGESVCNLIDIIKTNDGIWMVMEKGQQTLLDYLPNLKPKDLWPILEGIVESYMCFYEANVAHRDIKLSNLIIQKDQNGKIKIKFIDLELCEMNTHMYGTEDYLPKQIKSIRWDMCDIYAFGSIAKRLSDRIRYEGEEVYRQRYVEEIINGCMQDIDNRWRWQDLIKYLKGMNEWIQNEQNNKDEESIKQQPWTPFIIDE